MPTTFSAIRKSDPCTHGIDLRNGFGIQRSLLHVPNDADDAHPGRVLGRVAPCDPLPDWVGRPPDPARHGVVDDRHRLRLDGVFDAEVAPARQWDANGFEVTPRDPLTGPHCAAVHGPREVPVRS